MPKQQSITQDQQQQEWLSWIKHLTTLREILKREDQQLLTEAFKIFRRQRPCWEAISNEPDFTTIRPGEVGKWDLLDILWNGPTDQTPQVYFVIAGLNSEKEMYERQLELYGKAEADRLRQLRRMSLE